MTREQMIADIDRMTDPPYPADYGAKCVAVAAKLRAAVRRHNIKLNGAADDRLRDLELGMGFIWSTTQMVVSAGLPVLELWAIVKSTLEGKS